MTQKNEKRCSNCGHDMKFIRREDIQLGEASILGGVWPNIWAGALDVELWGCPRCGKLDLYRGDLSEGGEDEDHMAQTICPNCGQEHDLDDPKCPMCGAKNPNI